MIDGLSIQLTQVLLVLALAPLLAGLVRTTKARLLRRRGGKHRLNLSRRRLRHDRAGLDAGAVVRDPVDDAIARLAEFVAIQAFPGSAS